MESLGPHQPQPDSQDHTRRTPQPATSDNTDDEKLDDENRDSGSALGIGAAAFSVETSQQSAVDPCDTDSFTHHLGSTSNLRRTWHLVPPNADSESVSTEIQNTGSREASVPNILGSSSSTVPTDANPGATNRTTDDDDNEDQKDKKESLPPDDGMRSLRQRIHAIRASDASGEEKAQQIHKIMNESHSAHTRHTIGFCAEGPSTHQFTSRDGSPSGKDSFSPRSLSGLNTSGRPYYLTKEDYAPTYAPVDVLSEDDDGHQGAGRPNLEKAPELGCKHYKRNVKLQCYACKKCCDSYNTTEIRVYNENSDTLPPSGATLSNRSLARSIPGVDGPSGSLTAGTQQSRSLNARSVSPTVSNYFGLSRRRESIWTNPSQPGAGNSAEDNEYRENSANTSFWPVSTLRRATWNLLGSSWRSESGEDEAIDFEEDADDEKEDEDEDEETGDIIDIFGHR
ncbi:hypothetical protein LOZ61_001389 [Ophidiomyces ophidiicola]|nr:hypothetical protein LOZ61_001389 [Ophidiomyces ophidiicola]KAI1930330.1 hypothetical protein LOZ60_000889 [Ophidiomyces ophidiicola]KAI1963203.1 hypothetical protein LOZ56_006452 [Ophidiomyces ophidiicola]KAI1967191.1 hypothetical protein LOZ59_000851 [Ophidiomyces ophidiicola]KAI2002530.1 hypothetical protein LOZ49_006284 [Ophidiomyces ophidiicola]